MHNDHVYSFSDIFSKQYSIVKIQSKIIKYYKYDKTLHYLKIIMASRPARAPAPTRRLCGPTGNADRPGPLHAPRPYGPGGAGGPPRPALGRPLRAGDPGVSARARPGRGSAPGPVRPCPPWAPSSEVSDPRQNDNSCFL
jgi:hypothetical protein